MFNADKAAQELRSFVDPMPLVNPLEALRTHVSNLRFDIEVAQCSLEELRQQLASAEEALYAELDRLNLSERDLAAMDAGVPADGPL